MTGRIEKKLIELNIDLPNPAAPVASYSPFILSNKLLFISGQGPFKDGKLITRLKEADVNKELEIEFYDGKTSLFK